MVEILGHQRKLEPHVYRSVTRHSKDVHLSLTVMSLVLPSVRLDFDIADAVNLDMCRWTDKLSESMVIRKENMVSREPYSLLF